MDYNVAVRLFGAAVWALVEYRFIVDTVSLYHSSTVGQRLTQLFLGLLFFLLAFGAAHAIWTNVPPSWLTYAFPLTAVGMAVGQRWNTVAARFKRR